MLQSIATQFTYKKLTEEEQKSRGILGRLVGVIADFTKPTRNGRLYGERLWEKVFTDPIMEEKIETKSCFGELDHPADREETDSERIAICLAEKPKKGADGKLYGVFDILDTPLGRILKTMCDYGTKVGVSSRGSGDVFINDDGIEEVDADSYSCEGWDAVLLPAVKSARPTFVTESLHKNVPLTEALKKVVAEAGEDSRRVMLEFLGNNEVDLDDYSLSKDNLTINENRQKKSVPNREDDFVDELKKTLQENKKLVEQVTQLQEKLSACYAKEVSLNENLAQQKASIVKLTEEVKRLQASATTSQQHEQKLKESLANKERSNSGYETQLAELQGKVRQFSMKKTALQEKLTKTETDLSTANEKVKTLLTENAQYKQTVESLKTKYDDNVKSLEKNSELKQKEYTSKLSESNKLVEKYKRIANNAVSHFIESQARMLGCSKQSIIEKLPSNYSFDDIERICEDLRDYRTSMSKLPFTVGETSVPKISISNPQSLPTGDNADDSIDSLLTLVNNLG